VIHDGQAIAESDELFCMEWMSLDGRVGRSGGGNRGYRQQSAAVDGPAALDRDNSPLVWVLALLAPGQENE
jgi:hypothetical protein